MRSNETLIKYGYGQSVGTFGELLQGVLPSNRHFLVTLPIQAYSEVYFVLSGHTELSVFPTHKIKSKYLAEKILAHYGLPQSGSLTIDSTIPEGKGMASSSADLVATARAIASAYALDLPTSLLETFMSDIEPSDGVVYDGIVSYYQKEAILRSYLGVLSTIHILGIDEGGQINTIDFHRNHKDIDQARKNHYLHLLLQLESAVRKNDLAQVGKIATESAQLNQNLKPNILLTQVLEICKEIKGLGVVIAHSGTYIGILIDSTNSFIEQQVIQGQAMLKQLATTVSVYASIAFPLESKHSVIA